MLKSTNLTVEIKITPFPERLLPCLPSLLKVTSTKGKEDPVCR